MIEITNVQLTPNPVATNGTLLCVASVNYTPDWEYPVERGTDLLITQAYIVSSTGSEIEIE